MAGLSPSNAISLDIFASPEATISRSAENQINLLGAIEQRAAPEMIQPQQVQGPFGNNLLLNIIGAMGAAVAGPQATQNMLQRQAMAERQQAEINQRTAERNAAMQQERQDRLDRLALKKAEIEGKRDEFLASIGHERRETRRGERREDIRTAGTRKHEKGLADLEHENRLKEIDRRIAGEKAVANIRQGEDEFSEEALGGHSRAVAAILKIRRPEILDLIERGQMDEATKRIEEVREELMDLVPAGSRFEEQFTKHIDERIFSNFTARMPAVGGAGGGGSRQRFRVGGPSSDPSAQRGGILGDVLTDEARAREALFQRSRGGSRTNQATDILNELDPISGMNLLNTMIEAEVGGDQF